MPRRATPFDDKRARIAALASEPPAVATAELRRFLADRNGYIAGDAAQLASRLELRDLVPDLAAAFHRLLGEGADADKGCHGKKRILEALVGFEADVRDVYRAGVRYTQDEPAFGGSNDTAAPVRGLSAQALVQIDDPAALAEIAPLLADPEAVARAEAANALGRSGIEAAAAVLHLKVVVGDREPEVMQNAYRALLQLDPRRYLPVVAAALRRTEEPFPKLEPPKPPLQAFAEAAALALGESRLPEALPILKDELSADRHPPASVLMAIALLRSDDALALLLSRVEEAPEPLAAAALAALALHRHDPKIAERARSAVEARGTPRLRAALKQHLG